jgi:hypothetical protein
VLDPAVRLVEELLEDLNTEEGDVS